MSDLVGTTRAIHRIASILAAPIIGSPGRLVPGARTFAPRPSAATGVLPSPRALGRERTNEANVAPPSPRGPNRPNEPNGDRPPDNRPNEPNGEPAPAPSPNRPNEPNENLCRFCSRPRSTARAARMTKRTQWQSGENVFDLSDNRVAPAATIIRLTAAPRTESRPRAGSSAKTRKRTQWQSGESLCDVSNPRDLSMILVPRPPARGRLRSSAGRGDSTVEATKRTQWQSGEDFPDLHNRRLAPIAPPVIGSARVSDPAAARTGGLPVRPDPSGPAGPEHLRSRGGRGREIRARPDSWQEANRWPAQRTPPGGSASGRNRPGRPDGPRDIGSIRSGSPDRASAAPASEDPVRPPVSRPLSATR